MLDCHVDLEEELNNITNHAPEGEAARHGNYSAIQFLNRNSLSAIFAKKDNLYSMHAKKYFFLSLSLF